MTTRSSLMKIFECCTSRDRDGDLYNVDTKKDNLLTLPLSALLKRASAAGASTDEIEDALDDELDAKGALISLIFMKESQASLHSSKVQRMSSFMTAISDSDESDSDSQERPEKMPFVRKISRRLSDPTLPTQAKLVNLSEATEWNIGRLPVPDMEDHLVAVVRAAIDKLPGQTASAWQLSWCTPENVAPYYTGRAGDIDKASDILAAALEWRASFEAVLTGSRVPLWQGDLRVVARSSKGYSVIYNCYLNQARFPTLQESLEHTGLVLDQACRETPGGQRQFVWVLDIHGFRTSSNLDPRSAIRLMSWLKAPFRDRLFQAFIVDAPRTFSWLWNVAHPHMPKATREKVKFVSSDKVVSDLAELLDVDTSRKIHDIMQRNRSGKPEIGTLPTELVAWPPADLEQKTIFDF